MKVKNSMNTKTMKLLALLLAALMTFVLTACEVSSTSTSSVTVTTSKTDADGNTTTSTTTTQVDVSSGTDGVKTTTETTTTETSSSEAAVEGEADDEGDEAGLTEHLYATYSVGAKGSNEAGDIFFYAYNEDNDDALLVIISEDGTQYNGWEGTAEVVDDHVVLYGTDSEVPYVFGETEDGFTMTFLNDGDVATMQFVDMDDFVSDLVAGRMAF